MKKIIVSLLLLGALTVNGKPEYRIKTWTRDGVTLYLPQKRTNRIIGWESYRHPFQYISHADTVILEWKKEHYIKYHPQVYEYIVIK